MRHLPWSNPQAQRTEGQLPGLAGRGTGRLSDGREVRSCRTKGALGVGGARAAQEGAGTAQKVVQVLNETESHTGEWRRWLSFMPCVFHHNFRLFLRVEKKKNYQQPLD